MGKFSSDRAINEYAESYWNIEPCSVPAEKPKIWWVCERGNVWCSGLHWKWNVFWSCFILLFNENIWKWSLRVGSMIVLGGEETLERWDSKMLEERLSMCEYKWLGERPFSNRTLWTSTYARVASIWVVPWRTWSQSYILFTCEFTNYIRPGFCSLPLFYSLYTRAFRISLNQENGLPGRGVRAIVAPKILRCWFSASKSPFRLFQNRLRMQLIPN